MPKYRLKPGCKHYMRANGRRAYKFVGGDIIELPADKAAAIMDKLELVEEAQPVEEKEEKIPAVSLQIVHRGGGKYNVVNQVTGKPINDRLLTKEEAEELVENYIPIDEVDAEDAEAEQLEGAEDMAGPDGGDTGRWPELDED